MKVRITVRKFLWYPLQEERVQEDPPDASGGGTSRKKRVLFLHGGPLREGHRETTAASTRSVQSGTDRH